MRQLSEGRHDGSYQLILDAEEQEMSRMDGWKRRGVRKS